MYLTEQFLDLYLVFLVLDVEVVKYLLLFRLGDVGVVVLRIEFALPEVDFIILLLDKFDKFWISKDPENVMAFNAIRTEFASQLQQELIKDDIKPVYMNIFHATRNG